MYTSLALDSLGYPHISYHYYERWGLWDSGLRYAEWDGSEWLVELVNRGYLDAIVGEGTSIDLDNRSFPCIAYLIGSVGPFNNAVCYALWDGVKWRNDWVDSLFDSNVSLSLDQTHNPHLAYCAQESLLRHATRLTNVEEDETFDTLGGIMLLQNYPNPFSPQTTIRYSLDENSRVTLKVYNLLGQEIRVLIDELQPSGMHRVIWDATDNSGRRVPSGPYFLRLEAGEHTATRKLSVIR